MHSPTLETCRLHYPYRSTRINLFIFRFVSEYCLWRTLYIRSVFLSFSLFNVERPWRKFTEINEVNNFTIKTYLPRITYLANKGFFFLKCLINRGQVKEWSIYSCRNRKTTRKKIKFTIESIDETTQYGYQHPCNRLAVQRVEMSCNHKIWLDDSTDCCPIRFEQWGPSLWLYIHDISYTWGVVMEGVSMSLLWFFICMVPFQSTTSTFNLYFSPVKFHRYQRKETMHGY